MAGNGIARACEASLTHLGTDHLDLYLLHWPDGVTDLSGVVKAFENLRSAGKIRAWGVSNFKVNDLEDLFHIPQGDRCATNQGSCPGAWRGRRARAVSRLWCYCNTLEIFKLRHIAGRIAWSHANVLLGAGKQRGLSCSAWPVGLTIRCF